MKTSRTLKLSTLIELGACSEQVELFRSKFGESVRVTQKLCESVASSFNWGWAARNLLSAQALAEYERVTEPAWAEYERVTEQVWAEYERVIAPALAEYERVKAQAFAKGYLS